MSENTELRKSSAESDKKSRQQSSEQQEMKDELEALRAKVTKANEDLKKAQATSSNAMQEARVAVTNELSQVRSLWGYCNELGRCRQRQSDISRPSSPCAAAFVVRSLANCLTERKKGYLCLLQ